MKNKILLALLALFLLLGAAVSQTTAGPKHKAVIALTEPQGPEWNVLFLHVQNLQQALAKDGGVQVEVVFYGAGLNMLRKTNTAYEDRLKQMKESGAVIAACQNAMKLMNIRSEDLSPYATEVDSAMAELTRRQEAGDAYIH